jgi:7,8-dihydropterin-6-yl-methyl-4-(beta-D-ribofuranosyl)aminobenzene 5'-phosphate synthase
MMAETVKLKEVFKLEIISLVDNTLDFLSTSSRKEVQPLWQWMSRDRGEMPIAEHGFSMLVRAYSGENCSTILFDTGISPNGITSNAKLMGIDLNEVSMVVLSHGHYDHFGGLLAAIKAINRTELQLITHENMFKPRGFANQKGEIRKNEPFPSTEQLSPAKVVNTKEPILVADNLACVTGEIPRTVPFEEGFGYGRIFSGGTWQPDSLLLDDRALVFNVKSKGLVVISGCAHSGIINTIRYAQQITATNRIYAVLGGFHLAGKGFESRIKPTVDELKQINPELIAPSHCTGWRALYSISEKLPEAFVSNSVGNLYSL